MVIAQILPKFRLSNVLIFVGIYLGINFLGIRFFPQYALIIFAITIIIPFLSLILMKDTMCLILLYVSITPILQHMSVYSPRIGDFRITPHMIFHFFLILSIFSTIILKWKPQNAVSFGLIEKLLLCFAFSTIFSLFLGYELPVNHDKRWLLFYTGIFEPLLFFVIIVYYLQNCENATKNLLISILITAFSSLIIAFIEFKELHFDIVKVFLARMRYGFGYHNTNLFGIHSSLLIPIFIYVYVHDSFKQYKTLALSGILIIVGLSLLCFNRGTFIVLGLEFLLLFFIKESRKVIYWLMVGFFIIFLVFSDLALLYFFRFFGESNNVAILSDASANYRLEAWKVGLKLLFIYPFGMGGGSFQYGWELYGNDPTIYLGTPHQLFLSIGVDYGLIALILFTSILLTTYIYANRMSHFNKIGKQSNLFSYIKISLIGFVVYGLVTDGELSHLSGFTYPNNGYTLFLMIIFAFTSVEYNRYKNKIHIQY